MAYDTILAGKFYMDNSFQYLELGITDGRIEKIGRDLRGGNKKKLEGAIMPAGTDIHVHFRDPGETDKEDFRSGTVSAAYGGTTTVLDMPNNRIPVKDYNSFGDKLASVKSRAHVDFGLYSMFTGNNADLIDKRSNAIKIYLGGSTNSTPAGNFSAKSMEALKQLNIPVIFHGEDAECLSKNRKEVVKNLREHDMSRPASCELTSAGTIADLGLPKSVMGHISVPDSLETIRGKALGEVTPHHLLLNHEMELGPWGKANPPLRDRETQERNLQAYLDGKFHILSSDHAPHTEHDKEEFPQAPSGIIGVETRIPLMLALVQKKILSLNVLYETAIKNPAEMMGIKKGKIEVGYFADFFSFRPSSISRLNQERLHSKTPVSPFNESYAVFPDYVTMRGELLIDGGELVEGRSGKYLRDLGAPEA